MPRIGSKRLVANAGYLIAHVVENGSATMADILRERLTDAREALQYCIRRPAVVRET